MRPATARTTAGRPAAPRRDPGRQALLDAAPLILGYLPFALVLGATIASSPVPDLAGWATSPLIFAGAAQLATVDLLGAGVPGVVVVATALVVNLRHVMYSGALAPYFRDSPLAWRLVAPHFLVDPVYALADVRFRTLDSERARRRYYATLGVTLLVAWSSMTGAGVLLGGRIPDSIPLELAVPLVFVALLVPTVTDRPTLVAAATGGTVTIAAGGLPLRLGLIVGALAGVGAGVLAERVGGGGEEPGEVP